MTESNDDVTLREEVVRLDKAHVWHPYTAMDAYAAEDPIVVARAEGSSLYDVNGRRYLDGNSSWWVASLGHRHPRLIRAMREQMDVLDHCALAGMTHEPAARLAQELCAIAPSGLTRVFYTDNGSGSIEVALRMALQMWMQTGREKKRRFVALSGAFHGDTLGAASLGGVEVFTRALGGMTLDCIHAPSPEQGGYERAFQALHSMLREQHDELAAVVVEPMVQGAAGMRIYDARFLRELREECTQYDVLLIVDEVFTGYGRTGPMWACDHANITPDIMCLGKAFASLIPMGATMATERVFQAFGGDRSRALYYGHTFCGHPLGAALAREVLAIYREERVLDMVARNSSIVARAFDELRRIPGVAAVRSLGMVGAADLAPEGREGYLGDAGWRVFAEAKRRGAYLRPLGNTVYVTPPLTIEVSDLNELLGILTESIRASLT